MVSSFRRLGALTALLLAAATAHGQTYTHQVYLDRDQDSATGCAVATAAGMVAGADARLTATISGYPASIAGLTLAECAAGSFGAEGAIAGAYPVGYDLGAGGSDVIEFAVDLAALGGASGEDWTLWFVSTSLATGGVDAFGPVTAQGVGTSAPSALPAPAIIPAVDPWALLLLSLAMGVAVVWAARRYRGLLPVLLVGAALSVTGIAWAANYLLDGAVGDWDVPPLGSDAAGDHSTGEAPADLLDVYAARQGARVFFRADVAQAQVEQLITGLLATSFNVDENPPNGTVVGELRSVTTGLGSLLQFSLSSQVPANAFALDADGTLSVADGAQLDAETAPVFTLDVQVSVNGVAALTIQVDVTVTVGDINEAPAFADQAFAVDESAADGTAVGTVAASDSDGDTLAYTLTGGNTGGAFALDPATGALTVAATAAVVPANSPFALTVEASDGVLATAATVTVTVNDLNFPPSAGAQVYGTDEDVALVEAAPGLLTGITDPDGDTLSVLTAPASGPASGVLVLNADGSFSYTPDADFNGNDAFTYTVDDGNGGSTVGTVNIAIAAISDAPAAAADGYAGAEGGSINQPAPGVLGNDSDADGDAVTAVLVSGPANASSFTLNPDGSFSYTHDGGETVTDSFSYRANDGALDSPVTVVTLTITGANDLPVATADGYAVDEGATLAQSAPGVLGNDTDADLDALTAVLASGPANAAAFALNSDGSFSYEHDGGETTSDSFSYRANDGTGDSANVVVAIAITAVDDAPVAVADAATVAEDSVATAIDVLANDTDAETDAITIGAVTQPANGTVAITNAGADLSYTPNADYCNDGSPLDSFTYTVNGGAVAAVSVTVTCSDDAPVAVDDAAVVAEDSGASILDVQANDTDVDGGSNTVGGITQPANGTVAITNAGADLSYTPNANYCGAADTFTYTLSPGGSTASVAVTVTCGDDSPVAVADAATLGEDSGANAIDVLANDTDLDGGAIAVAAVTQGSNGSVAITNGGADLAYTPNADYCNNPPGTTPDSFTYTLSPGGSATTVTVTVDCANDGPAIDLDADDSEGTAGSGFATSFTEGDLPVLLADASDASLADVDSATLAALTVTLTNLLDAGDETLSADVSGTAIVASYDTVTGVLALTGSDSVANYQAVLRSILYFNSSDAPDATARVVQFVANDGTGDGNAAIATVSVTSVDTDPAAVDDAATVGEDAAATAIGVLANDTDPDGGPQSIASVTQPAGGSVVITGGGSGLTYAPTAETCNDGVPTDDFTYTLAPGGATATVAVTVTCIDDDPVAVADTLTVAEDATATAVDALANDTDADGGAISIDSVTQPANGTAVITGGGTGLSYTPNANYCNNPTPGSADTFTYSLTPGGSTAGVSVTVTCVEDDPVAVADAATVTEDSGTNAIDVLANDTDVDGGAISVTSVTQPAAGAVVITGGGTGVSFTPNANVCGADAFTYTLTPGGSSTTVSVDVTCVDDPPVAVADSATIDEDAAAAGIGVLLNDTDIDAGPKTIASATDPANGTVVVAGDSLSLTYTPDANYCNTSAGGSADSFSYTLNGGSSALVAVTVTCINDAPTVTGTASAAAHTHIAIAVPDGASDLFAQLTASDVDGPTPIVIGGTLPTLSANGGEVSVDATTGAFTYNPPANFAGSDSFAVQFCDSEATPACSTAQTVTLTVAGPEIWFVDDDAVVTGTRDGTLQQPFQTLALAATAANQSGNRIFVHSGSYIGGVTLANGVLLYGQAAGSAATTDDGFHEVLGITPATHGVALPAMNQAIPVIAGATNVIAMPVAANNTLDGVHIQTTDVAAKGIAGLGVGNLVVDEVTISGSGQAMEIQATSVNGSFVSVSSSGGGRNVYLYGAGTVDLGTGTLSGASGEAFRIGGTLSATYAGSITAGSLVRTVDISSHSIGTVTLSGALGGTGTGINFSNADGTYQLTGPITLSGNWGVTAQGGSSGSMSLSDATSTLTTTSNAILIIDSAPTLTYAGSMSKSGGASVPGIRIENNTGGTITLSGASKVLSTGTANAVHFANNAATVLAISGGGLDIDTTTGIGFNATGGGTVTVTGTENTVTTTGSGRAVSVDGLGGTLEFRSINKSGGGDRGISVTNFNGTFKVSGDGADGDTLPDSLTAGGTISGTSARGAELINVSGAVSLAGMTFTNAATSNGISALVCGAPVTNDTSGCNAAVYLRGLANGATLRSVLVDGSAQIGLYSNGVNGLVLDSIEVRNAGNETDESGALLVNTTGSGSITNSDFHNNASRQLYMHNRGGTLNAFPIVSSSFTDSLSVGVQGILIEAYGTATMNVATGASGAGNVFDNIAGNGWQVAANENSLVFADLSFSSFTNQNGIVAQASLGSTVDTRIESNSFVAGPNTGAGVISLKTDGGGNMAAEVYSNTIGTNAIAGSGTACAGCNGMFINPRNGGNATFDIRGNLIQNINGSGIVMIPGEASTGNNVNATFTGNWIRQPGPDAAASRIPLEFRNGVTSGPPSDNTCFALKLGGGVTPAAWPSTVADTKNRVDGDWHTTISNQDVFLWQRFATSFRLVGYPGTGVPAYVLANNTVTGTTPSVSALGTITGGTCP